jgi:hypothetical protein
MSYFAQGYAAARVRSQAWSRWICGEQNGTWAAFHRILRFPLPILIPLPVPRSLSVLSLMLVSKVCSVVK